MSRRASSTARNLQYYGDTEAKKYTNNTRVQQIQADMTYRALELLCLPEDEPAFLLDIGCEGYNWVGVDIAPSMLEVALEREVEGDLFLHDIGQGFGFDQEALMYIVIQWLLNAETSHPTSSPPHRLTRFFTTLHSALRNPSRAVLQFYPTSDDQIQLITSIAQKLVDYPNSKKAKKVFLCLFVGSGGAQQVPKGLDGEEVTEDGQARFEKRREKFRSRGKDGKRKNIKDKDWILKKKELYRQRGKEDVPRDSKYTARKRRPVF
ncbi:methyltransferase [Irpex lacteus]|nr:methyltransferase [Irpex lacteus]